MKPYVNKALQQHLTLYLRGTESLSGKLDTLADMLPSSHSSQVGLLREGVCQLVSTDGIFFPFSLTVIVCPTLT